MAAGLYKQLAQARPSGTATSVLYTPGTNKTAKVTAIFLCNTTAGAVVFSIYHDKDGSTFDETTALYFAQSLAANTTLLIEFDSEFGIFMNDSVGNLGFKQGTSEAITVTVYGIEEVLGTSRGGS